MLVLRKKSERSQCRPKLIIIWTFFLMSQLPILFVIGQIYCCVGFLSIVGRLDVIDADQLGWWLAERQLNSGGLNGRPEKLPDVCYTWWVLSCLSVLGRLHWIDKDKLVKFILASQDNETGGISDRPGDLPDPFHTLVSNFEKFLFATYRLRMIYF